jgi:3-keto-5-aminohexanoate cleavage enzyme
MVKLFSKTICDISYQKKWNIPEEVVIIAAVTGAYYSKRENPNQPIKPEDIRREAIESIEAGASSVHIHVRDQKTQICCGNMEYFHSVIDPIKDKYGKDVVIDGCAIYGETFEQTLAPITSGLFETSPVNATCTYSGHLFLGTPPKTMVAQAQIMQDLGCKPQIAIYDLGDIDVAYRYLIQPGILKKPYYWDILFNLPGGTPMPNPKAMMESLILAADRILEIDTDVLIGVKASGRASSYLSTLAMLMGFSVRVGMEDTIYRYPHKDDFIKSNAAVVRDTIQIAKLLGRKPANSEKYRELMGMDRL